MKIIDGKVWCNEVEKWVTPEEYEQNCKGVEYGLGKRSKKRKIIWHFGNSQI